MARTREFIANTATSPAVVSLTQTTANFPAVTHVDFAVQVSPPRSAKICCQMGNLHLKKVNFTKGYQVLHKEV